MSRMDYRAWVCALLGALVLAYVGCTASSPDPVPPEVAKAPLGTSPAARPVECQDRRAQAADRIALETRGNARRTGKTGRRTGRSRASKTATWSRAVAPRSKKGV